MKVLKANFRLMAAVVLALLTLGLAAQNSMAQVVALTPGIISTVAGDGASGYSNGSSATTATLSEPYGVAVDGKGNIYIADYQNNMIRVVPPSGATIAGVTIAANAIATVAGNGTACVTSTAACGDGGAATSAELNSPSGVAVDSQGNIYIADQGDNRIREVYCANSAITCTPPGGASAGNIATVAGNGTAGYSGDGGTATSAELNSPYSVAVDVDGNIYIADWFNNVVRVVSGGNINTIAGNGTACSNPTATPACGDGGAATSATLNSPTGVAVDSQGNVYIADQGDNRIRVVAGPSVGKILGVSISSGDIATIAGSGNAGYTGDGGPAVPSADLSSPTGLALDGAGDIYFSDLDNQVIRKVDVSGTITTVAGSGTQCSSPSASPACGDGGVATSATLSFPQGVALDAAGDIYIADDSDNRVREVNVSTSALTFANVNWYQTGSTQTVAVSNVGNAAVTSLSFAAVPNFSESNDCGGSLASGATCKVSETFAPTAPGSSLTQTVGITNSVTNATQTISVSGTATAVTPVFSNLTPSPTVPYGTSSIYLSGTIGLGGYYPAEGETVSISISGQTTQNTTIDNNSGGFALAFALSPTTAPATYTITYSYPQQDPSFNATTDGGTTSLTVTQQGTTQPSYTVTLAGMGTGDGTVKDGTLQIDCTFTTGTLTEHCSHSYESGTTVTLTATPNSSAPNGGPSTFGGWSTTGPCPSAGTGPCEFTVSGNVTATADFVPPPVVAPLNGNYCTSGSTNNNTASYQYCPSGQTNSNGVCTDPNGVVFTVEIPVVGGDLPPGTCFTLQATATEVAGTGICPTSQVGYNGQGFGSPGGDTTDFDCRFVDYYNFGTVTTGVTTPLCYPYSNGNCVFYHLELLSGVSQLTETEIPAGVLWQININPSNAPASPFTLPPAYTPSSGSPSPRMLDDPDFDEIPPLPFGTSCTTPMSPSAGQNPPSPPIYCQFDNDITTFFSGTVGGDPPTAGGKTKLTNDVVLAFLPTTPGTGGNATPPTPVAPSIVLECDSGCGTTGDVASGSTVTLTEQVAAAAQVTETVSPYPTPTLLISMTGTTSVTGTESGSTVTLTTNPSTNNFGAQFVAGVNIVVDNCLTAAYNGTFAIVNVSGNMLTYTNTATGLNPDSGGECMVTALPAGLTFNLTTGALSGTPSLGTAGIYPVIFTATNGVGSPSSPNYTLVISAISQAINLTGVPASAVYGSTFMVSATGGASENTVMFSSSGGCTNSGASYTMTSGTLACQVIANQSGNSNYLAAPEVEQAVTAIAASLAISAYPASASMTYGGTVPAITPSYSGFVNGDTAASLTTKPTCSTTATSASAVGSYPSSCTGAADPNYTITPVNGTVTVGPATLTITASSGTMTYGGTPPTITPSYSGFVNGQNSSVVSPAPTCSTTATSTSAVGSYASMCTGEAAPNYTITPVNGTVTVGQAPVIITASSFTMVQGSTPPAVTDIVTGLVDGQSASVLGTITCMTTVSSSTPPGTYTGANTCTGGTSDSNYSVSYASGTATVTGTWTITPNAPCTGAFSTAAAPFSVGQSGTCVFTVTNNTATAATVTMSIPGGTSGANDADDFAITANSCRSYTVPANGGYCLVTVTWTPDSDDLSQYPTGTWADLEAVHSGTVYAFFKMTGVTEDPTATLSPATTSSSPYSFGSTSGTETFTLTNNGPTPLYLATSNAVTISGSSDYKMASGTTCKNGTILATTGTCTVAVTFTAPSKSSTVTATVTITDNAVASESSPAITPQHIYVSGK